MKTLNRPGLLLVVALAGGLTVARISGTASSPSDASAGPAATYVQEAPYPPGFEQAHSPVPPWSIEDYVQEEGYAPGFEQAHH